MRSKKCRYSQPIEDSSEAGMLDRAGPRYIPWGSINPPSNKMIELDMAKKNTLTAMRLETFSDPADSP